MRAAGVDARRFARSRHDLQITLKGGPADPVSSCDLAIERMLREELARLYPGDRFWGEEAGMPATPGRGRVWLCDPIDGTRSFLRFGRNYCISLGLLIDGVTFAAFIVDPESGELYEAQRGEGARLEGEPLFQTALPDISHAVIGLGVSGRVAVGDHIAFVKRLLEAGALPHQHGSGALALAQTAAGRLDAYVELHMHAWDALPGLLIAREAGAYCIDWPDGHLETGDAVIAANPAIAATLFDWLQENRGDDSIRSARLGATKANAQPKRRE
jgi:myo-inositol-1(or 4)-monophosphatase